MFAAQLIKEILLATANTNLRTLTVLGPREQKALMDSLRGFEILTEFHTNWSLGREGLQPASCVTRITSPPLFGRRQDIS